MTFRKFIQTFEFSDNDIEAFKKWSNRSKFPLQINSPDAHIIFFHYSDKVIHNNITLGYKKVMIAYFEYDKNLLNKSYKNNKQALLETINKV